MINSSIYPDVAFIFAWTLNYVWESGRLNGCMLVDSDQLRSLRRTSKSFGCIHGRIRETMYFGFSYD